MNPIVLGTALLLLITGLGYFAWVKVTQNQFKLALLSILVIGGVLRFYASADTELHEWDEKYHALVAKNLVKHPLKPTLRENPVLPIRKSDWISSHVWLGKPTLPLWFMAGSIALIGNNLLAVRLPSFLLSMLAIWLTFLIGREIANKRIGILAAFFHAISGRLIDLASGRVSSDHVEHCFIVMVEIAVYFAILNFSREKRGLYSFLSGVFLGLAFLSKWHPALLVFAVWITFYIAADQFRWRNFLLHLVVFISGAGLIVFPWMGYMWHHYPDEVESILFKTLDAYSVSAENHTAPFYYYWHKIMVVYNELIYLPLLFMLYRAFKPNGEKRFWGLLAWICIPLIVFSFADTKRMTYILITAPAFFIAASWFWFYIQENFLDTRYRLLIKIGLALFIALPFRFMIERVKPFERKNEDTVFYRLPENERAKLTAGTIVFGAEDYIEIMFHTDVYTAYREIPHREKIQELEEEGFTVLLMDGERFVAFN